MGIFDKLKVKTALVRRHEEMLYEIALLEVEKGAMRPGLWAKALSEGKGDIERARGRYLKLRVDSLRDDATIRDAALERLRDSLTESQPAVTQPDSTTRQSAPRRGKAVEVDEDLYARHFTPDGKPRRK